MVTPEHIISSYSGGDYNTDHFPTKFLVFDLEGNYIKTLDVKEDILDCCYDKAHHRVIMTLDADIQFGYIDLNGLI